LPEKKALVKKRLHQIKQLLTEKRKVLRERWKNMALKKKAIFREYVKNMCPELRKAMCERIAERRRRNGYDLQSAKPLHTHLKAC
jgi:DNA-binding transcriptional MerR regulator